MDFSFFLQEFLPQGQRWICSAEIRESYRRFKTMKHRFTKKSISSVSDKKKKHICVASPFPSAVHYQVIIGVLIYVSRGRQYLLTQFALIHMMRKLHFMPFFFIPLKNGIISITLSPVSKETHFLHKTGHLSIVHRKGGVCAFNRVWGFGRSVNHQMAIETPQINFCYTITTFRLFISCLFQLGKKKTPTNQPNSYWSLNSEFSVHFSVRLIGSN